MYNKRKLGEEQEKRASVYLKEKGYEILEHNFFSRYGEIDLIARENEYLVFVEVKYRKDVHLGYPEESITTLKMKRILRTANWYMMKNQISENTPCRFDVVAMLGEKIKVIKNAFDLGDFL